MGDYAYDGKGARKVLGSSASSPSHKDTVDAKESRLNRIKLHYLLLYQRLEQKEPHHIKSLVSISPVGLSIKLRKFKKEILLTALFL